MNSDFQLWLIALAELMTSEDAMLTLNDYEDLQREYELDHGDTFV